MRAGRRVCHAPQSDAVAAILRSFPDGAFVVPAESIGLSVIRAFACSSQAEPSALHCSALLCRVPRSAAWALVLSARSSSRPRAPHSHIYISLSFATLLPFVARALIMPRLHPRFSAVCSNMVGR